MDHRIEQAHTFAKAAHDATGAQYNGKPYIVHPRRVAEIVANWTDDPLAQVVALLHDTVEDTGVTLDETRQAFGVEVAEDVAALTHTNDEPYMEAIARAAQRPRARLVKLADLTANIEAFDDPNSTKPLKQKARYAAAVAYIVDTYGPPPSRDDAHGT